MPEARPYYVVLIAEKDSNSYHFTQCREGAQKIFTEKKQPNKSAQGITFGELTIIEFDDRRKQ